MTTPKTPKDLTLAPVAVAIDENLQYLRDVSLEELDARLELSLNRPLRDASPAERARGVLEVATRGVDLHGWQAELTPDHARLHLRGGSVTLDLGLGAVVRDYIEHGLPTAVG
jgi:hypothetical protein